ncbi:hypothetical protein [Rhizobium arsenicireducens]
MKMLLETTGEFMLMDLSVGQTLVSHRPSVATRTPFIDARIALNQIVKLADLNDEATDEDFEEYWLSSEDRVLAIASFAETYGPVTATKVTEVEVTKKRGK